jgi:hypothetical protein
MAMRDSCRESDLADEFPSRIGFVSRLSGRSMDAPGF